MNFEISLKRDSLSLKHKIDYTLRKFPAGEIYVKLDLSWTDVTKKNLELLVGWTIRNSDELLEFLLLKNAIDEHLSYTYSSLLLKYVPYARQDRICRVWESFSIKVMSNLINSMNFNKVFTYDNHSDVSSALINNCKNISQKEILEKHISLIKESTKLNFLCSPDLWANKKVSELSREFKIDFLQADKVRDHETWKIIKSKIHSDELNWKNILILDDICDWGSTLIWIVKALKEKGANNIYIYVTHWIFSKWTDILFENGVKHIYTTDSYYQNSSDKNIIVLK